jgi:hypothetical protein
MQLIKNSMWNKNNKQTNKKQGRDFLHASCSLPSVLAPCGPFPKKKSTLGNLDEEVRRKSPMIGQWPSFFTMAPESSFNQKSFLCYQPYCDFQCPQHKFHLLNGPWPRPHQVSFPIFTTFTFDAKASDTLNIGVKMASFLPIYSQAPWICNTWY